MSESKIKFKYVESPNYVSRYVNGAFGGVTPRGEIVVNFFFEHNAFPSNQEYEITQDGKLGRELSIEPKDISGTVIRQVDTGVIMNINSAKELVAWLSDKIRLIENREVDPKTLN